MKMIQLLLAEGDEWLFVNPEHVTYVVSQGNELRCLMRILGTEGAFAMAYPAEQLIRYIHQELAQ